MLTPCEVAVKIALPSVRAMMANDLMIRHSKSQTEAARLLEISQPAVSLYHQKIRGNTITLEDDPEIKALVMKYTDSLARDVLSYGEKVGSFCEICRVIGSKGYLCSIHKAFDPTVDVESCNFCKTWGSQVCP